MVTSNPRFRIQSHIIVGGNSNPNSQSTLHRGLAANSVASFILETSQPQKINYMVFRQLYLSPFPSLSSLSLSYIFMYLNAL